MLATSGINQFLGTSDKKRAAKAIYCESEDSARGIQGTCRKAIQERCFLWWKKKGWRPAQRMTETKLNP